MTCKRTVMDYDRILVLEKGELVEYGSPLELIGNESGLFHSMCQETGEMRELVDIAESKRYPSHLS